MRIWADEETLCEPLGKWYTSGNELDSTWPSYYDFTNDCLYVWTIDGCLMYWCNPQNPCTFNDSQHVQWTPTDKTVPVK
eukprot:3199891-Ditylum_brightwellii.AAC.1